jgi:predicted RNA-binding protein
MLEKEHVIEILRKTKKAIKEDDAVTIRTLSDKTIHSSSIHQDVDNVALAVVLYALSKILEKKESQENWHKLEKTIISSIDNAMIALKRDDIEVYRDQIAIIRNSIERISGNLKKYVEDVFRKASINKASRLYEHGLSLSKTAKILGITLWDLNNYVGETGIADINLAYTRDLNNRIKFAQNLFKK